MQPLVLSSEWSEHQLIDSGHGRKLERFGPHLLIRSEPKAWWRPEAGPELWRTAVAEFEDSGRWRFLRPLERREWTMKLEGVSLEARLTDMSKHVGVFPEQHPNWQWLAERVRAVKGQEPRVLNLFGYTGAASLVAARAGARVTHVDASKPAVAWARQNQSMSQLGEAPVRWLLDDAFKFVEREIRRDSRYEMILLDPPSFGRGPKGEIWKVEQQIVPLLLNLRKLLSERPLGLILTMYNLEASSLMLHNLVTDVFRGGRVEAGELALKPREGSKYLPLSLFARWSA